RSDVHEMVETTLEPLSLGAVVVSGIGIGVDLETAAVVQFDQFADEKRQRMQAQVAGQIAESQLAAVVASMRVRPLLRLQMQGTKTVGVPVGGAPTLLGCGGAGQGKEGERRDLRL